MRLPKFRAARTTASTDRTAKKLRRWWPRLSRRHWLIVGLVSVVLAAGGGWFVWDMLSTEEPQSITATVALEDVTTSVSGTGTLTPVNDETLSFEVSGTIESVDVELGDIVKKNQIIATVDDSVLQDQLTAAKSTVTAAKSEVSSADSSGSSVRVASANAQLATAKDELEDAEQDLENAVLRAPFAGQVVSLNFEVGDVVGSSSSSGGSSASGDLGGSMGTSTSSSSGSVQIASVDQFLVETTVSSSDLESVKTGLQAEITATGVSDTLYGTVTEVGRVASTNSSGGAVYPVTVTVTGTVDDVHSGVSATVDIIIEKRTDVLTVPTRAISTVDGKTVVRLVDAKGNVTEQTVSIGDTFGSSTETLEGLSEGDTIEIISLAGSGERRPNSGDREMMPEGFDGQMPEGFPSGDFSGGFPGGGQGGFPGGGQGGN